MLDRILTVIKRHEDAILGFVIAAIFWVSFMLYLVTSL